LSALQHPDAKRLLAEISSVYVQCDDCGHTRRLFRSNLQAAAAQKVQSYMELCRNLRCSECPKRPPAFRNLTIIPTWICDEAFQTMA
jgi:hypothetical protein